MVADVPNPYIFPDPPETEQSFQRTWPNYFLFRRRPRFKLPPKPELPNPDTDRQKWDAYITGLGHTLVTQELMDQVGIAGNSIIREDVNTLNRTLVRTFVDEDYNANYWQNQYFLFQWLFALFALLATIFAALTTAATVAESIQATSTPPAISTPAATLNLTATSAPGGTASAPTTGQANNTNTAAQPKGNLVPLFGILTSIIGAVATVLVYIYNRDRPQRTWYEKRRNAESLRKQYFLYLTHMPPYDNQRHGFALQKMTTIIQNAEQKKLEIPADTAPRAPLTADDSLKLLNLYNDLRIQEQMKYYKMRSREYDFNGDVTLLVTLIIPLIVSILAGLNIAQISPVLAIIVVILPNLAGLFATFQRVYDWEHQQLLYRMTFEGLQSAKIIDSLGKNPGAILRELVMAVEGALTKESDQWGASVEENTPDLSAEQIIDAFKKKVAATDDEFNGEVAKMRERLKLEK